MSRIQNSILPIVIILYCITFSYSGIAQNDSTVLIWVKVTDLRSNEGKVGITVFDSPDGFPGDDENAIFREYFDINDQTTVAEITIPPGKYAIAVYHDEDENGDLKTNFIGMPKEGTGSSNNPKPRMGPPKYEDCEFDAGETQHLTIIMKYL